jgi:DNA-binding LacI/PurR family transcriptional regulator
VGGDFMAAGTVSALQKRGLRVPQDVSVMSIDGLIWRRFRMCR